MDAEQTRERIRKRYDVILPSGLGVTIRLPRLRECILAGNVPMPVLKHLQEVATTQNGEGELSPEETAHIARFQDEVVLRSLVAIEGEPVEMTPEAVAEFEQEDYDELVA